MSQLPSCVDEEKWLELTQHLLNSYRHWTGKELIERSTRESDLQNLWNASQVVVAHNTEADPVFVYGNQAAITLWELELEEFLGMPSRLTAEPLHRDERERLLARTRDFGFVDDYHGVRISNSGNRFRIEQATLWMVLDADQQILGQAATFDRFERLEKVP